MLLLIIAYTMKKREEILVTIDKGNKGPFTMLEMQSWDQHSLCTCCVPRLRTWKDPIKDGHAFLSYWPHAWPAAPGQGINKHSIRTSSPRSPHSSFLSWISPLTSLTLHFLIGPWSKARHCDTAASTWLFSWGGCFMTQLHRWACPNIKRALCRASVSNLHCSVSHPEHSSLIRGQFFGFFPSVLSKLFLESVLLFRSVF